MIRKPLDLIVKDPSSVEPYGFDWTLWLTELGAGIQASVWILTSGPDAALNLSDDSILIGSLKTQAYLSGGTIGARYIVTNRVTTNNSPPVVDERSFAVKVQNR